MITIWKTHLVFSQEPQTVSVPYGAEFLTVQSQYGRMALWFRCDSDQPSQPRRILLVGTGQPAPYPGESKYVGTILMINETQVVHVFELPMR